MSVMDKAAKSISITLSTIETTHNRRLAEVAEYEQSLKRGVDDYLRTGVALAEHARVEGVGTARQFFEGIAKERGRPFLYAEMRHDIEAIELVIPRTRKLDPVAAPLMLFCENMPIPHTKDPWFLRNLLYRNSKAVVVLWVSPNHRRFLFKTGVNDNDGLKLFNQWRENCAANPVLRICLGIPPEA